MKKCVHYELSFKKDCYYVYNNQILCWDCLLDKLAEDNKIEISTVTNYYLNSEYIGNDDYDYNPNKMEEKILDFYEDEIKIIKE